MPKNAQPANRKPSGGGKPAGPAGTSTSSTAAKSTTAKSTTAKSTAAKSTAAKSSTRPAGKAVGGRPPGKPKSIVNQKQRPWGLIITTIIIVLFAGGVVAFALTRDSGSKNDGSNPYTRDEIAAAKAIDGVTYRKEPDHNHVTTKVDYDASPPVGGNHAQYWADCTGTAYPNQIANENAVHALEHGAVWITYQPGLDSASVDVLKKQVEGVDRMLMSPYAGLKTKVSLQSWGYQLFVDDANDPRVAEFIKVLRFNPGTTPEPGASCSNPAFKTSPSTPDKPTF